MKTQKLYLLRRFTSRIFVHSLLLLGILICAWPPAPASAGGTTWDYILSMHSCDRRLNCSTTIANHVIHFSHSGDGVTWSPIPDFPSFSGSVADSAVKDGKLYVYYFVEGPPGAMLKVIDIATGEVERTQSFDIRYPNGSSVAYVDPSLVVDPDTGRFVVFYIEHLTPGGCSSYPCTLNVRSASEVEGSDSRIFRQDAGARASFTIPSGLYTDPDVFAGPTGYRMLVSNGQNVYALESDDLRGSYTGISGLTDAHLTASGGVPSGHYDATTGNYWVYVNDSSNPSGILVAVTPTLGSELQAEDFSTVVNYSIFGSPLDVNYDVSSPGFVVNERLAVTGYSATPALGGVLALILGAALLMLSRTGSRRRHRSVGH